MCISSIFSPYVDMKVGLQPTETRFKENEMEKNRR